MDVEKVKEIIANQLGADVEEITLDSSFADDLNADSLDLVELLVALEEEYDISIPDEDISNLQTVGDVVDYIKNHIEE
ncbi:MAG: acyl carrier protein [Clostridiaceae bacterium]